VKGKSHAHSSLAGRHSDSPDHPGHAAALAAAIKKSPAMMAGDLRHAGIVSARFIHNLWGFLAA
jgi:hypothetical protein